MSRYVPNHASMGAFMVSDQLGRPVGQVANRIVNRARVIATGYRKTGNLASSYRIVLKAPTASPHGMAPMIRWPGGPRISYFVGSSDPAAVPNEVGNGRTPERRILRRAGRKYHVPKAVEKAS